MEVNRRDLILIMGAAMQNRFIRNVSLVNPSDHKYRSWCRERRERTSSDRPRDPFA